MYLHGIWDKRKLKHEPDINMRNTEYTLYFIYMIYVFKFLESIYRLSTYNDFANDLIPETFFPMGFILVFLYLILLIITLLTFKYRKSKIGSFDFDDLNDNLDAWR